MSARSVAAVDKPKPWRRHFPVQTMTLRQFDPGQIFEAVKDCRLIDKACCDLFVAVAAAVNHKAMRPDRSPEFFVIHRPEPGFNVIDCLELLHSASVPDRDEEMQISAAKGD